MSGFICGYQKGAILGGDSDSLDRLGKQGSIDCRLDAYLGIKFGGSGGPPRRD